MIQFDKLPAGNISPTWMFLAYRSRNVAIYITRDYIVRQTIIHFVMASTTMNNNKTFPRDFSANVTHNTFSFTCSWCKYLPVILCYVTKCCGVCVAVR